jgi:hypothetical protein
MADFFNHMVRQAQGAAAEIWPLLPSRFADWRGFPQPGTDEGGTEGDLFPPTLVDPGSPASVSLPTLREMARPRSAHGSPAQPDPAPGTPAYPAAPDFEQDEDRRLEAGPTSPPAEDVSPGLKPPSVPILSQVQLKEGVQRGGTAFDSPVFPGETRGRSNHTTLVSEYNPGQPIAGLTPVATSPPATQPSTVQERSAPSNPAPAPAGETVDPDLRILVGTGEAQPEPGNARLDPFVQQAGTTGSSPEPGSSQVVPPARETDHAGDLLGPGELRTGPVAWPSAPAKGQPFEALTAPTMGKPTLAGSPEPLQARLAPLTQEPEPVESLQTGMPVSPPARAPAPASPFVQPTVPVPAQVVQRQAAIGGSLAVPLASPPGPASGPDLPVPNRSDLRPATAVSKPGSGALQPIPPTSRVIPPGREPIIVTAPEPASELGPGSRRPATGESQVQRLRSAGERPATGRSESIPTVRVTIGRVVVRLAPDAEPSPSGPVELPQPPLSLEEYLKGRQGGEV